MSKKTSNPSHLNGWKQKFEKETKSEDANKFATETDENIDIKPLYTSDDTSDLNFVDIDSLPGHFPYTRGPKASMYVNRPWTVRQYAGFSTAEDSNKFYRKSEF